MIWQDSINAPVNAQGEYAAKKFYGDPKLAAAYLPVAYALLGGVKNQMALSGVGFGHRMIALPDGTRIRVIRNVNQNLVEIFVAGYGLKKSDRVVEHGFCFLPVFISDKKMIGNSASLPPAPFGYTKSVNPETNKPVISAIGHVEWGFNHSIKPFSTLRGGLFGVFFGECSGNQFFFDGEDVWSYYGSGQGDLAMPLIESLYGSENMYNPYVRKGISNEDDNEYYTFEVRVVGVSIPVPTRVLYKNGSVYRIDGKIVILSSACIGIGKARNDDGNSVVFAVSSNGKTFVLTGGLKGLEYQTKCVRNKGLSYQSHNFDYYGIENRPSTPTPVLYNTHTLRFSESGELAALIELRNEGLGTCDQVVVSQWKSMLLKDGTVDLVLTGEDVYGGTYGGNIKNYTVDFDYLYTWFDEIEKKWVESRANGTEYYATSNSSSHYNAPIAVGYRGEDIVKLFIDRTSSTTRSADFNRDAGNGRLYAPSEYSTDTIITRIYTDDSWIEFSGEFTKTSEKHDGGDLGRSHFLALNDTQLFFVSLRNRCVMYDVIKKKEEAFLYRTITPFNAVFYNLTSSADYNTERYSKLPGHTSNEVIYSVVYEPNVFDPFQGYGSQVGASFHEYIFPYSQTINSCLPIPLYGYKPSQALYFSVVVDNRYASKPLLCYSESEIIIDDIYSGESIIFYYGNTSPGLQFADFRASLSEKINNDSVDALMLLRLGLF